MPFITVVINAVAVLYLCNLTSVIISYSTFKILHVYSQLMVDSQTGRIGHRVLSRVATARDHGHVTARILHLSMAGLRVVAIYWKQNIVTLHLVQVPRHVAFT